MEERLITSIMKDDGKNGLLTYNDLSLGTSLNIYKAKPQYEDRFQIKIDPKQNLLGLYFF